MVSNLNGKSDIIEKQETNNMKRLFILAAAALLFCGAIFAQDGSSKQISGGVLNGKATSLPKPAYPPAARAVNAEGAVTVQVLIDEDGLVVSASAVSGHPLLRAAAVDAAKGATFSPTRLAGQPVKVSGVITYNFVGAMTPGMFGYELGYAERAGRFSANSFAPSLAARLPETWTNEREVLNALEYEGNEPPPPVKEIVKSNPASADPNKFTVKGSTNASYGSRKLTQASVESVRGIASNIDQRLASIETAQWHFRLGRALGTLVAEIADADKTRMNASELETLRVNAPRSIPDDAIERIRELVKLAMDPMPGAEAQQAIRSSALVLRNLRLSTSW